MRVPVQAVGGLASHPVGWEDPRPSNGQRIPADGVRAAQWLRDHSSPRDLVVTNAFCRGGASDRPGCDNRTFWVSAYSERRTVLSGWGYTPVVNEQSAESGHPVLGAALLGARPPRRPFAPSSPSRPGAAPSDLRRQGARWVLVVPGHDPVGPQLAGVCRETFRAGAASVCELVPGT